MKREKKKQESAQKNNDTAASLVFFSVTARSFVNVVDNLTRFSE